MAHYLAECEVLRLSARSKRLHRLEELASQDGNKNAAVAAIKAAEGIIDDAHAPGRAPLLMQPGITIVITGDRREAPPHRRGGGSDGREGHDRRAIGQTAYPN
jgi:hypothetical protein